MATLRAAAMAAWRAAALASCLAHGAVARAEGGPVAPAPILVWERTLDVPVPGPERQGRPAEALDGVLALAGRSDSGAVVVVLGATGAAGWPARVLAFDGAGKPLVDHTLSVRAAASGARSMAATAAVDASAPDRIRAFVPWMPRDGDAGTGAVPATRLVGLDPSGRLEVATDLPPRIADSDPAVTLRTAAVPRRMPDGSLTAGGTAYYAPPYWWYARFTTGGRLLHEAMSRGFPDYIEDVRGNEDGGFSLAMVDADGESEKAAVRRYGADGRLAARHRLKELAQDAMCSAALTGPAGHVRAQSFDAPNPANPGSIVVTRSELVWHEAGKGVVARLPLGPNGCMGLSRAGTRIVAAAQALGSDEAGFTAGLAGPGRAAWRLDHSGPTDRRRLGAAGRGGRRAHDAASGPASRAVTAV